MIDDKLKCIFVHPPRVGGTSIETALGHGVNWQVNKHLTARELKGIYGEDKWSKYFKFTFVRNTWERLVSVYHLFIFMGWITREVTFKTFLESELLQTCNMAHIMHMITDENDKIAVDFIGRYENLQGDFNKICKRLKIKPKKLTHETRLRYDHDLLKYYTDESVVQLVATKFKDEIEYFKFKPPQVKTGPTSLT